MRPDPLDVLRQHIISEPIGIRQTPGTRAVEIERALARAGFAIVPSELAALFSYIIARHGIDSQSLDRLLISFGLAKVTAYDPAKHTGGGDSMLPGDAYLEYAPALVAAFEHARPHLGEAVQ